MIKGIILILLLLFPSSVLSQNLNQLAPYDYYHKSAWRFVGDDCKFAWGHTASNSGYYKFQYLSVERDWFQQFMNPATQGRQDWIRVDQSNWTIVPNTSLINPKEDINFQLKCPAKTGHWFVLVHACNSSDQCASDIAESFDPDDVPDGETWWIYIRMKAPQGGFE